MLDFVLLNEVEFCMNQTSFTSPKQSILVGHSDRIVGLCIISEPSLKFLVGRIIIISLLSVAIFISQRHIWVRIVAS